MRKNAIVKKAFTLVEILIVLIVTALLIGVLFQVYRNIADVSLRVRYEKDIGNKVVTMQTMIQNIIDTHTIDYAVIEQELSQRVNLQRDTTLQRINQQNTNVAQNPQPWWMTTLPLRTQDDKPATLVLQDNALMFTSSTGDETTTVSLLWDDVQLLNATFVLMPMTNPQQESSFNAIYQPGVWVIGTLSPVGYSGAMFPLQTYFTTLQR